MVIAVASGKGGTGKTTVAVALAKAARSQTTLLDCDVEEPNVDIFFSSDPASVRKVYVNVPTIESAKCKGCGECANICQFNAIAVIGAKGEVFPDLCHSCGGCMLVCKEKAFKEYPVQIGFIKHFVEGNLNIYGGELIVGQAMSPPLIREVKKLIRVNQPTIIDSPPGTSCPMVTSVRGSDYIILVTDSTPFGLYDLKLSISVLRNIAIPFGVVINRSGLGDSRTEDYCRAESLPVLMKIPNDKRVARAYSEGTSILDVDIIYKSGFEDFYDNLDSLISKPV